MLNGLRHNKPRAWEVRALSAALDALVPEGRQKPADGEAPARWLDVLPCNGIVTDKLSVERRGYAFDVVERTPEVAAWVAARTRPRAGEYGWPADDALPTPPEGAYDVVSCLYRLEDLRAADRVALLQDMARWVKPGGRVLVGFVNANSFHDRTERLRARRGGPKGVEYVLSPDPNIGPFQTLRAADVEALAASAGRARGAGRCQAVPQPEEIAFRARNFSPRARKLVTLVGKALGALERLPGAQARRGRFQFRAFRRPG